MFKFIRQSYRKVFKECEAVQFYSKFSLVSLAVIVLFSLASFILPPLGIIDSSVLITNAEVAGIFAFTGIVKCFEHWIYYLEDKINDKNNENNETF